MFVLLLTYTKPLAEVDTLMRRHMAWLDAQYEAGRFVVSGRRIPRTGGVIVARGDDREEIEALAASDPFVKGGVARLLEEAGIEVVGQAADAPDLLRKVGAHKPDVAVIDIRMPPDLTDDGLRAAIEIRRRQPDVGVLVLSQHLVERFVAELVGEDARGVGYLLKHRVADLDFFIDAVRKVAAGGT